MLRAFTLKRVHKKSVESLGFLGFFADKERKKGKERKLKGRVTGKN